MDIPERIMKLNHLGYYIVLIFLLFVPIGNFHFLSALVIPPRISWVFGFTQPWILVLALYGIFGYAKNFRKIDNYSSSFRDNFQHFNRFTIHYVIFHSLTFFIWYVILPSISMFGIIYKFEDCILSFMWSAPLCTGVDIDVFISLTFIFYGLPLLILTNNLLLRLAIVIYFNKNII